MVVKMERELAALWALHSVVQMAYKKVCDPVDGTVFWRVA